ncbi:hypothetical protein Acr_00g0067520 [Actinidia rufa]|uniref:Uncharacterized protein n=1 Tax=Actinidia rufa TaxID=165716 RepID=A0A7J0DRU5_9ERIC|nr:hypothetical protein Acr_00g0067520 [Actinidia rufa]
MGITSWHKSHTRSVRLGRICTQTDHESHPWLKFWRKIKRENQKQRQSSSSSAVPSYDSKTYLQNFDEGSGRAEPENIYQSFSARFADPSKSF